MTELKPCPYAKHKLRVIGEQKQSKCGIGGWKMANEKQIAHVIMIQRALGIIEGVAIGLNNDAIGSMLYTATEMIEEAVEEITKDGK